MHHILVQHLHFNYNKNKNLILFRNPTKKMNTKLNIIPKEQKNNEKKSIIFTNKTPLFRFILFLYF